VTRYQGRVSRTVIRSTHAELARLLRALNPGAHYEPPLDARTTALLCIDMQRMAMDPGCGYYPRARELGLTETFVPYWTRLREILIPNVVRLQRAARTIGIEVIHLRVAAMTRDGRDNGRQYKRNGLVRTIHDREAEFMPDIAPVGDEIVISKTTSSAFNSTNIDRVLRNMGIANLIVVGVATHGCVESTVRSAAELDYGVYVVEDATASDAAHELHEHAILTMAIKDAAIISTEEMLRRLDQLRDVGGARRRVGAASGRA
jgi:nicotinamidase-related amidase